MAFRLPRLPDGEAIVNAAGRVSFKFQRWWQSVVEKIEAQERAQDDVIAGLAATQQALTLTQAELAAAQTDLAAAVNDLETAQNAITTIQGDLTTVVIKAQTPAWVSPTGTFSRAGFVAYAGQSVSNPPTQAEVQAIDDQVKEHSQRLAALIADLRTAGVLA